MEFDKVVYENNIVYILIDQYKKITQCTDEFDGSSLWDDECGLEYIYGDSYKRQHYFPFRVIDQKKFFLAKIKYGI